MNDVAGRVRELRRRRKRVKMDGTMMERGMLGLSRVGWGKAGVGSSTKSRQQR